MDLAESKELERFKHRLKWRELAVEKLLFAAVVALLGFYINARLESQKADIGARLSEIDRHREAERVLAERRIAVIEDVWKALVQLRGGVDPLYGKRLDPAHLEVLTRASAALVQSVDTASLFLPVEVQRKASTFSTETLQDFLAACEQAGAQPPREAFDSFLQRMNEFALVLQGAALNLSAPQR